MKVAFALPLLMMMVSPPADVQQVSTAQASVAYNLSVEAPWTAKLSKSDPARLELNVMERKGSMLGTGVMLADLEGSAADLDSGRAVTFRMRREAGVVTFTGRFRDGQGEGTLRYEGDVGYWSRIAAMGIRNDLLERRTQLLALPLLDVRTDYIAALRREGAMGELSDYVGMKALGVTPDYVAEMRAAGARIETAGDAQSFRALGISPSAVKRTIARGRPNPRASDVIETSYR